MNHQFLHFLRPRLVPSMPRGKAPRVLTLISLSVHVPLALNVVPSSSEYRSSYIQKAVLHAKLFASFFLFSLFLFFSFKFLFPGLSPKVGATWPSRTLLPPDSLLGATTFTARSDHNVHAERR